MGYGSYSKATRETAENLRIIDDAMFRLVAERKGVCAEECKKIGLAEGRSAERKNAIRKMLGSGLSREMILSMDYSETELEAVEQELFAQV